MARSNKHSGENRIRMEALEKRVLYSADPVFAPLLEGLVDNTSHPIDSALSEPLFQPTDVSSATKLALLPETVDTHGADLERFDQPFLDQSADTTSALIARYEFNNSTGEDSVGSADGVITNSPNFVSGQLGSAMSFAEVGSNGQPSMVVDGAVAPDVSGGDKSITFWIKASSGAGGTIIDHSDSDNGYRVLLLDDNRMNIETYFSAGGYVTLQGVYAIPDDTWTQISITQTEGEVNLYNDGLKYEFVIYVEPYALSNASSDLIFGQSQAGTNFFNGSLDDIRFYDRQLSDDDVNKLVSEGANTEEAVDVNSAISMVQGDHVVVSDTQLSVSDNEQTPAQIVFTIDSLAPAFDIQLNGSSLNVNGTFTQQDINDGLVVVAHDGVAVVSETLGLSVDDGIGDSTQLVLTLSTSANAAPTDLNQVHSANDIGLELNLAGDAAYFAVDDAAALFGGLDQLTYELSFETETLNPPTSTLIAYGDNLSDKQFQVDLIQSAGIRVHIANELWLVNSSAAQAVMDGDQHTLAVTWDSVSGETNLLVDGVVIDSTILATGDTIGASGSAVVGNDVAANSAASFSGVLHDMRLFDYARSQIQIEADQETNFGFNENGLVAYWKFDSLSHTGQVASEVSANHLNPLQATFAGADTGTVSLADGRVYENSAIGTEVMTVQGIDPERQALLANILSTTPDIFYSPSAGIFLVGGGESADWDNAYTDAALMTLNGVSGHLAMPNNGVENALMAEAIQNTVTAYVWLGANNVDNNDEWVLVKPGEPNVQFSDSSGNSINGHYINWATGEPNFFNAQEFYGEMHRNNFDWNDNSTPSITGHRYFSEFDAEDVLNGTAAHGSLQRELSYSIAQQTVAGAFAIDAQTGVVSVADNTMLNFETNASHTISVVVQDNNGNTFEKDFVVVIDNINDAPDGQNDIATVNEGGDVVIDVVANDLDPDSDILTVAITKTPSFGFASVDADNKIVYLHDGTENFTDQLEYEITDNSGEKDTATVTINVIALNENAPVITASPDGYRIPENALSGLPVGAVTASDDDTDDTFTFSLANDAGGRFEITPEGDISVVDGALLDKEQNAQHVIIVAATDAAGNIQQQSIEIDILDEVEPITGLIGTGPYFVLENVSNGTALGLINAIASDDSGVIDFSLANSADGRFAIDAVSGNLSVADASLLDFESQTNHEIEIVATDATGASVSVVSSVQLIDVNEAPLFTSPSYTLSIAENPADGSSVGFVAAQDPEVGPIQYTLQSGEYDNVFSIDADTGELFVVKGDLIDYEIQDQYNLVVVATDISGQTDTSELVVNIENVDDAATLENPDEKLVFIENDTPLLVSPNAVISDVDSEEITSIEVVIENYIAAEDRLLVAQSFDFDIAFDEAVGRFFISGPATIDEMNAVLQQIQYSNVSNNPTEETRLLKLIVTDANNSVAFSLVNIDILAENDALIGVPTISGTQEVGGLLLVDLSNLIDLDDIAEYQIQWSRDGIAIDGQTSDSYSPTDEDINTNISVQVSIVDGAGNVEPTIASDPFFIEDPNPEIAEATQEEENEIDFAAVEAESLANILSSNNPVNEEAEPEPETEPEASSQQAPVASPQFEEEGIAANGVVMALAKIDFGASGNDFFETVNPINSADAATISREIKLQSNEFNEQVGSILALDPLQVQLEEGRRLLWQADNIGMTNSLNEVIENLSKTVEQKRESGTVNDALVGTSLSITAGLLVWLLRGGALLASVFSVSPLWKQFDPLPIVNGSDDNDDDAQNENHQEDADVDRLFEN